LIADRRSMGAGHSAARPRGSQNKDPRLYDRHAGPEDPASTTACRTRQGSRRKLNAAVALPQRIVRAHRRCGYSRLKMCTTNVEVRRGRIHSDLSGAYGERRPLPRVPSFSDSRNRIGNRRDLPRVSVAGAEVTNVTSG
jgi:hypothetical protein